MLLQFFEDPSPTIIAAMRLQPRCSEKTERESGDPVITTRILVPSSQIGCLIGRGGAIISEMRNITRAGIRILSNENLPKVAYEDEEMVQVNGIYVHIHGMPSFFPYVQALHMCTHMFVHCPLHLIFQHLLMRLKVILQF